MPGRLEELTTECRFDLEDGIILADCFACDVGGREAHDGVLYVSGKSFLLVLALEIEKFYWINYKI